MYDDPHSEVGISYDFGDFNIEFEVTDALQMFLLEEKPDLSEDESEFLEKYYN